MSYYQTKEPESYSRATSIRSSRSRRSSTMSRAQTLIKRNIDSHDLRPSDIIIERFVAWKAIVKQLVCASCVSPCLANVLRGVSLTPPQIAYFEGVADIENNTARELTKLGGVIQVPFRAGNQFLGEGGLQDIFYNIRDKTRVIADHHANLGRTIDSSIVQHLQKLHSEIKVCSPPRSRRVSPVIQDTDGVGCLCRVILGMWRKIREGSRQLWQRNAN